MTCDQKDVSVRGIVDEATFTTSKQGTDYMTFYLTDGTNKLKVFSRAQLDIVDGDLIQVDGSFYSKNMVGDAVYYNEVVTDSSKIYILKRHTSWIVYAGFIIIGYAVVFSGLYFGYYKPKKRRGKRFERYVLSLLDDDDWKIKYFALDVSGEIRRNVASDSWPDIIVQHRKTKKEIGIECKYFSRFSEGPDATERKLPFKSYQLTQYKTYETKQKFPIYIIAGVGGNEKSPQNLYIIPLKKIEVWVKKESTYLPERIFNDYEITPRKIQIEDFVQM